MDGWEETKEISLKEMDQAIKELRLLKAEYEAKNKIKQQADADYKEQQAKVLEMMASSGKSTYICEGIGRVSIRNKMAVRVPATPEDKKKFFDWVRNNLGEDSATHYASVHSQSLNRLYNDLTEEYAGRGEVLDIDGIESPQLRQDLSFTKV